MNQINKTSYFFDQIYTHLLNKQPQEKYLPKQSIQLNIIYMFIYRRCHFNVYL